MRKNFLYLLPFMLFSCTQSSNPGIKENQGRLAADTIAMDSKEEAINIPDSMLLGLFEPSKHIDFVKLNDQYAAGSAIGQYLHKETLEAFKQMKTAAAKEGVKLIILSATRNFYYQKQIWEKKWTGLTKVGGEDISKSIPDPEKRALTILKYSSMPGTSRHHWGSDIDLNSFSNRYFESGQGLKEYEWLNQHAASFGFCQPYTNKKVEERSGYEEEKWHWSYMPISSKLLQAYLSNIQLDQINGFQGSEVAGSISVIDKYVGGISDRCLEW